MTRPMADAWVAAGLASGPRRHPRCTLFPYTTLFRSGQLFQGGAMYWSPGTGAFGLFGAIREHWGAQRWEAGPLGYPTGAMTCDARGCGQPCAGGQVVW